MIGVVAAAALMLQGTLPANVGTLQYIPGDVAPSLSGRDAARRCWCTT